MFIAQSTIKYVLGVLVPITYDIRRFQMESMLVLTFIIFSIVHADDAIVVSPENFTQISRVWRTSEAHRSTHIYKLSAKTAGISTVRTSIHQLPLHMHHFLFDLFL